MHIVVKYFHFKMKHWRPNAVIIPINTSDQENKITWPSSITSSSDIIGQQSQSKMKIDLFCALGRNAVKTAQGLLNEVLCSCRVFNPFWLAKSDEVVGNAAQNKSSFSLACFGWASGILLQGLCELLYRYKLYQFI